MQEDNPGVHRRLLSLKNNQTLLILLGLLLVLVVPRVLVYVALGSGMVPTDAEARYLPQAEELGRSFGVFFSLASPVYSTCLYILGEITGNMVVGMVIVQHILGIGTGLLVFFLLRRINPILAFIVTVLVFSSVLMLWVEHSILREAIAGFCLVAWLSVLFYTIGHEKQPGWLFGVISALIGVVLVLVRIEYIALVFLMPVIFFIVNRMERPDFRLRNRPFLKWTGGYTGIVIVFILVYILVPGQAGALQTYDRLFNIAWHALQPEVFYYDNSRHPELRDAYQQIIESEEGYLSIDEEHFTIYRGMAFEEATKDYLASNPEIGVTVDEMLDGMYVEMMTRNTGEFLRSYAINVQNHFLGQGENIKFTGVFNKNLDEQTAGIPPVNWLLRVSTIALDWVYGIFQSVWFFWLFLGALLVTAFRWKKLPGQVMAVLMICLVHILVLAFIANSTHRFRLALDPLLLFAQLYIIYYSLAFILTRPARRIRTFLPLLTGGKQDEPLP